MAVHRTGVCVCVCVNLHISDLPEDLSQKVQDTSVWWFPVAKTMSLHNGFWSQRPHMLDTWTFRAFVIEQTVKSTVKCYP